MCSVDITFIGAHFIETESNLKYLLQGVNQYNTPSSFRYRITRFIDFVHRLES
jgi:hypothetical protein